MRLVKGDGSFFRCEPYDQIGFHNAATHVAVYHECNASEHLPFGEFGGSLQNRAYAVCQVEIVRHQYLSLPLQHTAVRRKDSRPHYGRRSQGQVHPADADRPTIGRGVPVVQEEAAQESDWSVKGVVGLIFCLLSCS